MTNSGATQSQRSRDGRIRDTTELQLCGETAYEWGLKN